MSPFPDGPGCRIAVLPFLNDSDYPQGNIIVQKVFTSVLQNMGDFQIVQDGDILKTYQKLALMPRNLPSQEDMLIIADHVYAQFLITGVVMEMREDPSPNSTVNPMVVIELQLRDGRSGKTLWKTFHRRRGIEYKKTMHFGTQYTVTGLSRKMAEEIITIWFRKGLVRCNVL